MTRTVAVLLVISFCLAACQSERSNSPLPVPTVTLTTPAPTATAVPLTPTPLPPTPTPLPVRVWVSPAIPTAVREQIVPALAPGDYVPVDRPDGADLHVGPGPSLPFAEWVYALVVPFPTLIDEVSQDAVVSFWNGEVPSIAGSGDDGLTRLYITPDVLDVLSEAWGAPGESAPLTVITPTELLECTWDARPHGWSIVPFSELQPRWKALKVDGVNVLDKHQSLERYALRINIGAEGVGAAEFVQRILAAAPDITNRETTRMTQVVMTGVTALVRGIAHRMEEKGLLYPIERIGPLLTAADILHISNEISFAKGCPSPDPQSQSLAFCSDPSYVELLKAIDVDVIELTGNHVKDYGSQPMLDTIATYRDMGWLYYGGGQDLADARRSITMTNNGNSVSFTGCNLVGPEYAWADVDEPGAAPCDEAYMSAELARLREAVDVPIATYQYWEFYQYEPTDQQRVDFRRLVDAGALIVSGSQAHHPQALEFYKGGFIHYGLGNLFFDQMWSLGTRQEIVDRHLIYQGRHVSTELLTFMLEDYAQPRPMTTAERVALLKAVFAASGW